MVQTRFDRADGHLQSHGNLCEVEAVDKSEKQDFPLGLGQAFQHFGQAGSFRWMVSGGRLGFSFQLVRIDATIGLGTGCFLSRSDREVSHRGVHETPKLAGQLEAGKLSKHVEKSLLENVQGQTLIPGDATGQVHNPVAVTAVKGLEGIRIALINQGDKGLIRAWIVRLRFQWLAGQAPANALVLNHAKRFKRNWVGPPHTCANSPLMLNSCRHAARSSSRVR